MLIHDVNPSQLNSAFHRGAPSLREALLNARRDTVTHRATTVNGLSYVADPPRGFASCYLEKVRRHTINGHPTKVNKNSSQR